MQQHIGRQLGAYQIVEQIGQGGMATVFKAYQPSMDRYVAIKILPSHLTQDESFVGRFTQEAHTLARLEHPHILPVHDYGEQEGTTYLVMRYVRAGTLKDLIARDGPMGFEEVARILSEVGSALEYAHSKGVVHRDIKLSNVLVDETGFTLLTDFGIAKLMAETAQFTASGGIIGTPAYMSPEQGMGRPVDHRCDIYSLGVMLYELVTGRVPFEAETPLAVLLKHINDPLPLPRQLRPDLPEAVERVILKAMAKVPDDRYQSAQAMANALKEAVASRPPDVVPPSLPTEPVPPPIQAQTADEAPLAAETAPFTPHAAAAAPARRLTRWLLPVAAVVLVGVLVAAGVFVARNLTGGGPAASGVDSGQLTPAGVEQVQASPGWTNYGNANFVLAVARQGDILWAGGENSLVRWDLTDGSITQLGRADGLASNRINDLLVDEAGVLWIATDAGISRYDGETIVSYDEADGLDANVIQVLFLDAAGGLWAGSREGERGLNYYDGESWGAPPVAPLPVESPNVQALDGTEGDLVVGLGDQGLAILEEQEWTVLTAADGLPGDGALDVLLTDDEMWVSSDEAVVRFDRETLEREVISQTNIIAMHETAGGELWLGGEFHAVRFDPESGDWQEFDTAPGPIPGWIVTDIVEDEDGLWFGAYGGGVAFYDGSRWETWATDEELGGNQIEAIRQGGDGALWFTHQGTGLSRYDPASDTWQVFGTAQGALDWPSLPAVDSDGNLWIGEYGELLYYDGQTWQPFTSPELADVEIYAIAMGPNDVKWLVTDGGLLRHDPVTDEWRLFTGDDHPIIEDVWSLLVTSDGTVWIGGEDGLAQFDGETWHTPEASGSPPQLVDDLAEAPDGSLWVVADGVLGHLDDGRWSYSEWPSEGWAESVAVAPDGSVWVGYEGLGRYDPATSDWQIFAPSDGLVNRIVRAIHVTPEGVVWIGTEGGVSRYVGPD
jgi:ligand-binding sensor domain-containing protein/tRNA A-37 threonylcarbamoyl transferase component Bud32